MKRQKSITHNFQHRITLLENFTKNELESELWQARLSVYSEIKPLYMDKFLSIDTLNFGHIMTEGYYIFKIRYAQDVSIKMRILFKQRYFEIKRIINIAEQSKFLNIIGLEIYVS